MSTLRSAYKLLIIHMDMSYVSVLITGTTYIMQRTYILYICTYVETFLAVICINDEVQTHTYVHAVVEEFQRCISGFGVRSSITVGRDFQEG